MSSPAEERTYLPAGPEATAEIVDFLAAHRARRGSDVAPQYFLAGAEPTDRVELPKSVFDVLVRAVEAMSEGRAVSIVPRATMLTTQQAADLLGVSRPTVVRLIDQGTLPSERPGSRRKVRLDDVLAHKERTRSRQYEMLAATALPEDDDEDLETVLARVRAARKTVAHRPRVI